MFKTVELYIFEDRNKHLCMRIAYGDNQTRKLVLTALEADQLTSFMVSVSQRYALEVVGAALEVARGET